MSVGRQNLRVVIDVISSQERFEPSLGNEGDLVNVTLKTQDALEGKPTSYFYRFGFAAICTRFPSGD